MDWDHLRHFLELARTGTLVGAARRLGVDHTTVSRRLAALEKQLGAALFAREAGGHRLTEAGRQLLVSVEAMEAAVSGIEQWVPAGQQGPVLLDHPSVPGHPFRPFRPAGRYRLSGR